MDELPIDAAVIKDGQHALETLQGLEGLLQEARQAIGDPDAFGEVLNKLARLTEGELRQLVQLKIGAEEKAQIVRLQAQIVELERVLQTRVSVFSGFSQYLKTLVDGKGSAP